MCVLHSCRCHFLLSGAQRPGKGDLLISVQAVEPIRIPVIDVPDEIFSDLVRRFITNPSNEMDEEIDNIIFNLYGLNSEEREYIVNNYR